VETAPLIALLACAEPQRLVVRADGDLAPVVDEFVGFIDDERVVVGGEAADGDVVIDVELGDGCAGCYRAESTQRGASIVGADVAGAQYGLADAMERMGFGFFHPWKTRCPAALSPPTGLPVGEVEPAMSRRGIHLHTLHPIEGLQACYVPDESEACARVVDWVVKNRGNYLQWPALDDITSGETDPETWAAFSTEIADDAHRRGVEVGVGVQLFGSSNLQSAFDLVDEPTDEATMAASMDERLAVLAPVPWDMVSLSFGEFSGEDPQVFIDAVDLSWDRMQAAMPGVEVNGVIHVGDTDDTRVTYDGQDMIYYFLVQYSPEVLPWVHTVMYYDLVEDAGGAYHHEDFSEHAAFLADRIASGEPVGYFPETAYWVAFDNPVPLYLPLYMRSRALDLETFPDLDSHVLFSSGWEWGYWQNDVLSLRLSHTPGSWESVLEQMLGETAGPVVALADLQHDALIDQRLAPYLAGREAVMDAGATLGIVSQPERVSFDALAAYDEGARSAFVADVLDPLADLAAAMDALDRPKGDRWADEVADGVAIDALRATFVHALYAAVADDDPAGIATAEAALADAQVVVARRGAAFHHPDGGRWEDFGWNNPTIYDYGYLAEAQSLCFWRRELAQVRNLLQDAGEVVPACVLD
jgi:hypothetical protein